MSDKEIIKALECCISKNNCTENCPYVDLKPNHFYCIEKSTLDAIDFIKRRQVEIEELKSKVFGMEFETAMYKAISESARVEAIKEFAEKLKANTPLISRNDYAYYLLLEEYLDDIVKEMEGRK